ncbi:MAG: hypothetical protein QXK39_06025 [Nitrososphaerota archaeon]
MKIIGGLGYILALVPLVNIVSPILISIAWIQMGGRTRQTLFKVTGAAILGTFIIAIAFIALFLSTLFSMIAIPVISAEELALNYMQLLMENLILFLIFAVVMGVLAIGVFVLEVAAHFRASAIYSLGWFRAAAWLRIVTVIAVILLIGFLVTSPSQQFITQFTPSYVPYFPPLVIPLIILGILAQIFSGIAFFKIPETPPPQPYQSY